MKVRKASNSTPSKWGTVMGVLPVAIQIKMPCSCSRRRVSTVRSVISFFCMSIKVPSISKKIILILFGSLCFLLSSLLVYHDFSVHTNVLKSNDILFLLSLQKPYSFITIRISILLMISLKMRKDLKTWQRIKICVKNRKMTRK